MRLKMQIAGLQECFRKLQDLERKAAKKAARAMASAGGKVLSKALKEKGKQIEKTGQYWRSIGFIVRVYRNSGVAVAVVGTRPGFRVAVGVVESGPRKGEVIYVDPQKYDHLLEYGTIHAPAVAPLRRSLAESEGAIKAAMEAEVAKAIGEVW